jgi:hypothetical protein
VQLASSSRDFRHWISPSPGWRGSMSLKKKVVLELLGVHGLEDTSRSWFLMNRPGRNRRSRWERWPFSNRTFCRCRRAGGRCRSRKTCVSKVWLPKSSLAWMAAVFTGSAAPASAPDNASCRRRSSRRGEERGRCSSSHARAQLAWKQTGTSRKRADRRSRSRRLSPGHRFRIAVAGAQRDVQGDGSRLVRE